MPTTIKLSKWGNSAGARLNTTLLEFLGVSIDDYVDVTTDEKTHTLIIKKHTETPDSLADLLEGWGGDFETHAIMAEGNVGAEIG